MRAVLTLIAMLLLCSPVLSAEELTPQERHALTTAYLEGNLGDLDRHTDRPADPDRALPLAIYEHYWRTAGADAKTDLSALIAASSGLMRKRYEWLRAPIPRGAFPVPAEPQKDPWRVIAALVLDRQGREGAATYDWAASGAVNVLAASMRAAESAGTLNELEIHQLAWIDITRNDISSVYQGTPPTAGQQDAADEAASIASRNRWLAIVAVMLLLAIPIWVGRRLTSIAAE